MEQPALAHALLGRWELLEQMADEGRFPSSKAAERWRGWMERDESGFGAALYVQWEAKRET